MQKPGLCAGFLHFACYGLRNVYTKRVTSNRIVNTLLLAVLLLVAIGLSQLAKRDNALIEPMGTVEPLPQPSDEYIICGGAGSVLHEKLMWPIIQEAYLEIGIDARLKSLPALRSLEMAHSTYDGEVGRLVEVIKQYKNLIPVPVQLLPLDLCVFTLEGDEEVKQWSDLTGKAVGIRRGVMYIEKKMRGHEDTLIVEHLEQAVGLLAHKRLDVVVAVELDFYNAVKAQRAKGVNIPPIKVNRFERVWIHHCVNKKNKHLISALSKVLGRMVEEGRFDQVMRKTLERNLD